jgi:hypothetical protein
LHSGIDLEIPIGAYEIADLGGLRPRAKHNGRQIHFWRPFSLSHRRGENYCEVVSDVVCAVCCGGG